MILFHCLNLKHKNTLTVTRTEYRSWSVCHSHTLKSCWRRAGNKSSQKKPVSIHNSTTLLSFPLLSLPCPQASMSFTVECFPNVRHISPREGQGVAKRQQPQHMLSSRDMNFQKQYYKEEQNAAGTTWQKLIKITWKSIQEKQFGNHELKSSSSQKNFG